MQPDAPALLWDARRAVQLIQDFIAEKSLDQYERDAMLRLAVERQFEVIGEALNKLKRADPDTAARIADVPKIVAFRNILAHGYATIDNLLVWQFANTHLVELSDVLGSADRGLTRQPLNEPVTTARKPTAPTMEGGTSGHPRPTCARQRGLLSSSVR